MTSTSSKQELHDSLPPGQRAAGEALLEALTREARKTLTQPRRTKFDAFIARNERKVVAVLSSWVLDDALKNSRAALPDDVLFGSDWAAMKDSLVPIFGNYWAMDALVRRATERGPEARAKMLRLITNAGLREYRTDGESGAINAIIGKPWSDWEVPVYSRSTPVNIKKAAEPRSRGASS